MADGHGTSNPTPVSLMAKHPYYRLPPTDKRSLCRVCLNPWSHWLHEEATSEVTVHLLVCGTCGGVTESKYALHEEGSTFYCSTPCFAASLGED